jgi:hypothetical protein
MNDYKSTMPKEIKDKWLTALRSGEYQQGKGMLCNENKYCCLGVLEMAVDGRVETCLSSEDLWQSLPTPSHEWLEKNGIIFRRPDGYFSDTPYFDLDMSSDSKPDSMIGNALKSAVALNDVHFYTFEQIADLIEAQVEGV